MKSILSFALLLTVAQLAAQPDTIHRYDLPDVILRENRLEMPFSEVSRTVNVITSDQIRNLPARSTNELLSYVAGIDLRQRGVHGVQADVSIRGGTFDQTLVMINGVKLNDPQTGHHLLNLPIDVENIERIEVLKGPGARVFGMNAFAGAINIVTRAPEEPFVKIGLQAGENTLGGGKVSVSFPQGEFRQYFSVAKDFSEGYRHNTDYDITNFFYQNSYQHGNHELSLLAGYTDRRFGANGFYASPAFTEQYEEVQTTLVSLQYQHRKGAWQVTPRFSWRRNQDEYIFVRSNPSLYRNLHISNVVSLEVNARRQSSRGATGLGAEVSRLDLNSTNLGNRQRNVLSLFAEHRFQLWDGRVDLTPGVSLNHFSDFGTRLFPGIDAGWRVSEFFKLYANAGYTYRIPTFTDLYYEDPANLGNPDLQPEEALSYELGAKWTQGGLQVQLSYFQRNGFDLIDWTRAADTLQWRPVNLNELITQGADLSADVFFPVWWGPESVLQRLSISYTYIDAQLADNEAVQSRYVLENLDHQLVAGLDYRLGRRFFHNITFRHVSRVTLDDYNLVDSKLTVRYPRWEIFVAATNIFDAEYTETNLVPMPGRWVTGGVAITFR